MVSGRMIRKQRQGRNFEEQFLGLLGKNGFWAHRLQQTEGGQPADIICAKDGKAYLFDCKHCTNTFFRKDRVEPNQRTAAWAWRDCGNPPMLFAVKINGVIYIIAYDAIMMYGSPKNVSIPERYFQQNIYTFDEWVESKCEKSQQEQ